VVFLAALLAACASTSLSPGPGALTMPGAPDIAAAHVDGVEVTVQANAWQGDRRVSAAVQTVRITINNNSDSPIRLRYSDFALVAPDGHKYAALPPFKVEGEIMNPVLAPGYGIIVTPRFYYRGFFVAPYYSRIYPGIPVYGRRYYFYDPFYYDYYYQNLVSAIRPTVEMLGLGLPEGVIQPGGSVTGFLYFEHVEPGVPEVSFRQNLVAVGSAARGEASFGEISIPFTVTTVH
jgi:hypothetical protein